MSDDAPAFFNAWSAVFGVGGTRKLLCSWHIAKNWSLNVKKKIESPVHRTVIAHHLYVLLKEQDEKTFRENINSFLLGLETTEPEFFEYFLNNYCDESRLVQWAAWARRLATVNTNMYLERFHRTLKYKYLERKHNHRLDFLIYTLFKVARDYLQSYTVDTFSISASSYRLSCTNTRHRNSWALKKEQVTVIETGLVWEFKSKLLDSLYTVR